MASVPRRDNSPFLPYVDHISHLGVASPGKVSALLRHITIFCFCILFLNTVFTHRSDRYKFAVGRLLAQCRLSSFEVNRGHSTSPPIGPVLSARSSYLMAKVLRARNAILYQPIRTKENIFSSTCIFRQSGFIPEKAPRRTCRKAVHEMRKNSPHRCI